MSPTLPPAQILRKTTNDSLNRLVSTIPSSAIQVRKSPRRTVWYMKDDPSPERWTFYIGKDGKILYVDRQVKAATAGEDAVARLKELKVL